VALPAQDRSLVVVALLCVVVAFCAGIGKQVLNIRERLKRLEHLERKEDERQR
jgi:hypothetical protein